MLKSKYKKLIRAFTSGFKWSRLKCVIQSLFDQKGIEKNETTGIYEVIDESRVRSGEVQPTHIGLFNGTNHYIENTPPLYSTTANFKLEIDVKRLISSEMDIYTEFDSGSLAIFRILYRSDNTFTFWVKDSIGNSVYFKSTVGSYGNDEYHHISFSDDNGDYTIDINNGTEIITGSYSLVGNLDMDNCIIGAQNTGSISYIGVISNLKKSQLDGTILHNYQINESSQKIIYDSVGGVNGLLNNPDDDFWDTDNSLLSIQNKEGYSEKGFGENIVFNGGAFNTTDWVDNNTTGLGDGWFSLHPDGLTFSIIDGTSNGFSGKIQRADYLAGITFSIGQSNVFILNQSNKIVLKYRSSTPIKIMRDASETIIELPINTDNAIEFTLEWTPIINGGSFTILTSNSLGFDAGDWFEIDEVQNYIGSSQKIPIKLDSGGNFTNLDVLGNTPTYIGKVGYNVKIVNSSNISFDGINDNAQQIGSENIYNFGSDDFFISTVFKSSDTDGVLIGKNSVSSKELSLALSSGKIQINSSIDGSAVNSIISDYLYNDDKIHELYLLKSDTKVNILIDGFSINLSGVLDSDLFSSNNLLTLGSESDSSGFYEGSLSELEIGKTLKSIDLYMFAGQSNMSGDNNPTNELGRLENDQIHFYSYDVFEEGINADTFLSAKSIVWGAELSFGTKVFEQHKKKVAIVKISKGGTSFGNNDWNKGDAQYNNLLTATQNAVTTLQGKGYTVTIKGLAWMLGESDSTQESWANNYSYAFNQFFLDLQSDLGISLLQLSLARIQNSLPIGTFPYKAIVRDAQNSLGAFNTDYYPLKSGDVHYNGYGLVQLGYDFYKKFVIADVEKISDINHSHFRLAESNGLKSYGKYNEYELNINGATWGNNNARPDNLLDGYELYDDDATHLSKIRVPYRNDGSKITPTIAGYSKISDNDPGKNSSDSGSESLDYPSFAIRNADEALTTPIRTDGSGNFVKVPYSTYNDGDGNFENIILYNKEPIKTIVTLKPDSDTLYPDCFAAVVKRLKLIWQVWNEWGSP